jgi:PAS domain S-box-containing protein
MPFSAQAEKSGPVITVGSEINFPPYAIADAEGRASGFSVELLEAVADAMGLPIKVTTGLWPEVLAAFKAGESDLLPLVALSAHRADIASYTKPHTVAFDSFFVRRGNHPISSLAEAKDREIIVMSSDAAHEELLHSGLPIRIIETKTIPEAMRLLASGKHDAVLVPKLLGLIVLHEAKLEGVIEAGKPIADYNRQFAFAVQRGNTDLRDKLEEGIAIVRTTGRYDAIYRKWFGGIDSFGRRLKTIVVNNYHPYTYMNEKGVPDGFSVEIVKAVAKTMDLELEIRVDKWDQSMKELETGGIDLIPMMAYSPERDKLFDFSVPYTIAYDSIFFKKGVKGIRSLNDLNGKTVIVTNNDAAHGYLLSSDLSKTMNITLANSLPDALEQLAVGKGDAAIMPKLVGLVVAKNLNLTDIDVSPDIIAGYNRPWCFAVRNGDHAMLDRLNQGLNIIKTTGEYDAIYKKWFGALEDPYLNLRAIIKYGSFAGLILLFFIVWSVVLKHQVRSKTRAIHDTVAALQESERKTSEALAFNNSILKTSSIGILTYTADGQCVFANEAVAVINGTDVAGLLAQNFNNIASWQESGMYELALRALSTDDEQRSETHLTTAFGKDIWLSLNFSSIQSKGEKYLLVFTQDISLRKQSEDQLINLSKRLQLATSSANLGVWDWNVRDNTMIWDDRMFELYGITRETFSGNIYAWMNGLHPDDKETTIAECQAALTENKVFDTVFRVLHPDRTVKYLKATGLVLRDADGTAVRMIGVNADITERKMSEEKITASLQEKEVLLKEIHHRVKNNLQIITSLLRLQANYVKGEEVEEIFRECQYRVAAMADVHSMLYKSQDFAAIDFGNYVRETAGKLRCAYGINSAVIFPVIHIEDVMLPIDTAIPCGLLINELLTNSLKYAFPGGMKGEVTIEMQRSADGVRLLFADNGVGFPTEVDFSKAETFGLKLVHMLVKQLDGSIERFSDNGTRYEIMFNLAKTRDTGHA